MYYDYDIMYKYTNCFHKFRSIFNTTLALNPVQAQRIDSLYKSCISTRYRVVSACFCKPIRYAESTLM